MARYRYALINSADLPGTTNDEKAGHLEAKLNDFGNDGYRLRFIAGPEFIMEYKEED